MFESLLFEEYPSGNLKVSFFATFNATKLLFFFNTWADFVMNFAKLNCIATGCHTVLSK
jgi:hypothetical protein